MRLAIIASLMLFTVASSAQPAPKPSFDCSKASFADEHTICDDPRLSELDQAASIAFGQIPADEKKDAESEARDDLAARHACGPDRLCILDQQVNALEFYDGYGPKIPVPPWVGSYRLTLFQQRGQAPVDGLPKKVAQCTMSKITAITDRFGAELKQPVGDAFDSGSAIDFADDGHQVSYSFEPEIAASAIGDQVLVCLVSIPKNCPKGDDRGKFYSTTNLRTKGSWILPDAQHMCGGA